VVDYAYNRRKWLDSLVATRGGTNIFRQILRYDSTGQITQQRWKQGAGVYDSLTARLMVAVTTAPHWGAASVAELVEASEGGVAGRRH